MKYRIEKDSLGEVNIDNKFYYGINTQRAIENFSLDNKSVNLKLIYELAIVKKAAAMVNKNLKQLSEEKANAIIQEHNTILASEKDREIFFNALVNPGGPNQKLRDAAERYKLFLEENK